MNAFNPGTRIGRYTLLGKLATGGMSELHLARQVGASGFHKVLVLKVILPNLAEDEKFIQMFENEAKVAAMLNHPNVVQVYDFGTVDDLHYLAMEYIDGLSLRPVLERLAERRQTMSTPLACRVVSDVAAALAYAHDLRDARGQPLLVMHRDVSLENILVTYAGQVKLVDFGLAKARTLISSTTQGTLKGKYRYMSPEMIGGKPIDHRIDIFALGVVLYALLTGRMPFEGSSHTDLFRRILTQPPTPPRAVKNDVPLELERVILRALEKEPAQRYQRASEMQGDLEAYMVRTASVVAPYQLAQFMAGLFPHGSDKVRMAYQQMAGVTPAPQPSPDDITEKPTAVEAAQSSPLNAMPTAILPDVTPATQSGPAGGAHGERWLAGLPTRLTEDSDGEALTVPGASGEEQTISRETVAAETVAEETVPAATVPSAQVLAARPGWPASPAAPPSPSPPLSEESDGDLFRRVEISRSQSITLEVSRRRWAIPVAMAVAAALMIAAAVVVPDWFRGAPTPAGKATARADVAQVTSTPRADAAVIAARASAADGPTIAAEIERQRVAADAGPAPSVEAAPDARPMRVVKLRRKGRLTIFVWPYATVSLDGRVLGSTPLPPVAVTEGTHVVVVENARLGARRELRVRVKAGREAVVKVKLE
jgi:serine/threonine protein kinase